MTLWDGVDLLSVYFYMLWKSFSTTILSGTAMGMLMAQLVGLIGFLWIVYLVRLVMKYRRKRTERLVREFKDVVKGKLMSAKEETERLSLLAQDAITDAFETLYADEVITLEQKDFLYEKIAKACKWEDLLRFAQASKKEQIKRKLDPNSKHYAYKRVKLPEPAVTAVATVKRWTGGIFKKK